MTACFRANEKFQVRAKIEPEQRLISIRSNNSRQEKSLDLPPLYSVSTLQTRSL